MSSKVPEKMKAAVIASKGKYEVREIAVPTLSEGEVLVKVDYAACNPTDFKHLDGIGPAGSIMGCDIAGTVVAVSSGTDVVVGDRVAGFVHGGKFPDKGAYAEYAKAEGRRLFKVPDGMSLDEAATFGCAFVTAGMALFYHQGLDLPPKTRNENEWFFISGGSTSVGLFTISLAKAIGLKTIVTSSPSNFDLCKKYGATETVSYRDTKAAIEQIKELTKGGDVIGGLDCVGGEESLKLGLSVVKDGAMYTTLLVVPGADKTDEYRKGTGRNVKLERIVMYTIGGYHVTLIPGVVELPANPKDSEWFLSFVPHFSELLNKYGVKGNPVQLREGLDSVGGAMDALRSNKVSGEKIVIKIA